MISNFFSIKKHIKKIPMDYSDSIKLIGKPIKNKDGKKYLLITEIVELPCLKPIRTSNKQYYTFEELMKNFVFLDGSEICKKVEKNEE